MSRGKARVCGKMVERRNTFLSSFKSFPPGKKRPPIKVVPLHATTPSFVFSNTIDFYTPLRV